MRSERKAGRGAKAIQAVLLIPFLFTASANAQDSRVSAFCNYAMLYEIHESATRCGSRLDNASEARYNNSLAAIKKYILDNAHLSKRPVADPKAFLSDYEQKTRARFAASAGVACRLAAAMGGTNMGALRNLTSQQASARFLETLKKPKDPFGGSCI